jgi:uncharacterized membrane protein
MLIGFVALAAVIAGWVVFTIACFRLADRMVDGNAWLYGLAALGLFLLLALWHVVVIYLCNMWANGL